MRIKTSQEEAERLYATYIEWEQDLDSYRKEIIKDQELYEDAAKVYRETDANLSLNTQLAIVESDVARFVSLPVTATVTMEGESHIFITQLQRAIAEHIRSLFDNVEVSRWYLPFSKVREMMRREFNVKGNVVAELRYMEREYTVAGRKEEVRTMYPCVLNLFDVVFNPSKTLATSDRYFVRKHVSLDDLKRKAYGRSNKSGIYRNIDELEEFLKGEKLIDGDSRNGYQYVDGAQKARKLSPLEVIECWKDDELVVLCTVSMRGKKRKVFVIREAKNILGTGRHPLYFAMGTNPEGRPYGRGMISAIRKPIMAQNALVNQLIDSNNAQLRPAIRIGDTSADSRVITTVFKYGGAFYGPPGIVETLNRGSASATGFTAIEMIQQGIERASRYSPYAAGTPSQATDKTSGTATGIQSLQKAAEPNFEATVRTMNDMLIEPLFIDAFRASYHLMSENEIIYTRKQGGKYQGLTKGILSGAATIKDFEKVGAVTDLSRYTQREVLDEYGNPTRDPDTGDTLKEDIEGAEDATVLGAGNPWKVRIDLDVEAANKDADRLQQIVQFIDIADRSGVPVKRDKLIEMLGQKLLDLDPEEFIEDQQQMPTQPGMPAAMPQQMPQPQMPGETLPPMPL